MVCVENLLIGKDIFLNMFFGENFFFVEIKTCFFFLEKKHVLVEIFFLVVGENMLFCEKIIC